MKRMISVLLTAALTCSAAGTVYAAQPENKGTEAEESILSAADLAEAEAMGEITAADWNDASEVTAETSEDDSSFTAQPNTADAGLEETEAYDAKSSTLTMISEAADTMDVAMLYDDTMEVSELEENYSDYVVVYESNEEVTSTRVSGGKDTGRSDSYVVTYDSDNPTEFTASGTGTAYVLLVPTDKETDAKEILNSNSSGSWGGWNNSSSDNLEDRINDIDWLKINVTVSPANLTVMYLAGQSNMEGACSETTGYQRDYAVQCDPDDVYSTYVYYGGYATEIISEPTETCTIDNVDNFVAGSLTGTQSISGETLDYPLDGLSKSMKTGCDAGLAYEWNQLTGDKVWVVNAAISGTKASYWEQGAAGYDRAMAVFEKVKQVYEAEISSGHYTAGDQLLFWLQGESDRKTDFDTYEAEFFSCIDGFTDTLETEKTGVISVRSSNGAYNNAEDLSMTAPRLVQLLAAETLDNDIYMVSMVNEQWVSDDAVKAYFEKAYPDGYLTYPTEAGVTALPTTVKEVHEDIHYSQIAHNENGITAARGMYEVLYGDAPSETEIFWTDYSGVSVDTLYLLPGESAILVPVAEDPLAMKALRITHKGASCTAYDSEKGVVTASESDEGTDTYTLQYGSTKKTINIVVSNTLDLSSLAGKSYTGVYYYRGIYWYLKNGVYDASYKGLAKDSSGNVYYMANGQMDSDYTGLVKEGGTSNWWYIENGKVDLTCYTVAQNSYGWWCVRKGKIDFTYTGVAQNSNGWWRIVKGKVDFSCNSVEKNEYGWWYIRSGKVDFTYTGVAQNSYGWWRIVNGKVDFDCNSVEKNSSGWWYIRNGKVDFSYTGVAKNSNGWWRIVKGKVDFNCNSVEKNEYGWWYIVNGKVDFSYTGIGKNAYGYWYIKNGKLDFDYSGYVLEEDGSCWIVTDGQAERIE